MITEGQQAHVAESAQASSAIIQQMKEVINSTSITNSVASGKIASSSVAMLQEELTGEVRKRHGNKHTLQQSTNVETTT